MFHESDLTDFEQKYYTRQVIVPGIGIEGQIKLRNARILIAGHGDIVSTLLMYLSSCGPRHSGFIKKQEHENYIEEYKNILLKHSEGISVDIYDYNDISEAISDFDILLDCSEDLSIDNRLLDLSTSPNKFYIKASVVKSKGYLLVFSECCACKVKLYDSFNELESRLKDSNFILDDNSLQNTISGFLGSIMAVEAIKCITGDVKSRIFFYNSETNDFKNTIVCTEKCID